MAIARRIIQLSNLCLLSLHVFVVHAPTVPAFFMFSRSTIISAVLVAVSSRASFDYVTAPSAWTRRDGGGLPSALRRLPPHVDQSHYDRNHSLISDPRLFPLPQGERSIRNTPFSLRQAPRHPIPCCRSHSRRWVGVEIYEKMGQERKRCAETVQITCVGLIAQPYSFYFPPIPLSFLSPFFPMTVLCRTY